MGTTVRSVLSHLVALAAVTWSGTAWAAHEPPSDSPLESQRYAPEDPEWGPFFESEAPSDTSYTSSFVESASGGSIFSINQ